MGSRRTEINTRHEYAFALGDSFILDLNNAKKILELVKVGDEEKRLIESLNAIKQ